MTTALSTLRTVEDILTIAKGGAVALPVPAKGQAQAQGRVCKTDGQVLAGLRWAATQGGNQGALLKTADGAFHEVGAEAMDALADLVPTRAGHHPLVCFVGKAPSEADAARGAPLVGLDGVCFKRDYLAPLGLDPAEVMVTNLLPCTGSVTPEVAKRYVGFAKAEIAAWAPRVVVALGKAAKDELGALAQYTLPHPAVVRRAAGECPELTRKVRKLRADIQALRDKNILKVSVRKMLGEKRIVYGVTLDPYQYDSQDDWVPCWEIEQTAHAYLENHRVIGLMHEQAADAVVVESWLWPYPSPDDYALAMRNEPHQAYKSKFGSDWIHSGAWVLGTRIDDPECWQAVLDGKLAAYSIGGYGVRQPVDGKPQDALPKVTFIDQP